MSLLFRTRESRVRRSALSHAQEGKEQAMQGEQELEQLRAREEELIDLIGRELARGAELLDRIFSLE